MAVFMCLFTVYCLFNTNKNIQHEKMLFTLTESTTATDSLHLKEVLAGVYQSKLGTEVFCLSLTSSYTLHQLRNVVSNIL